MQGANEERDQLWFKLREKNEFLVKIQNDMKELVEAKAASKFA